MNENEMAALSHHTLVRYCIILNGILFANENL